MHQVAKAWKDIKVKQFDQTHLNSGHFHVIEVDPTVIVHRVAAVIVGE